MGYITLRQAASAELTEKRSRFLAEAAPVQTEEQALAFLAAIKARDRTVSHNVFAYRLRERNLSRYSDDGEPSGTAGLPVLDVLERGGITDAVLVVTRWFGGTLLGTGGLVRAYSGAAKLAVEAAGAVTMELCGRYRFRCGYGDYERALRLAADAGASAGPAQFLEQVELCFTATQQPAAQLDAALRELTRGKAGLELLETGYLPLP